MSELTISESLQILMRLHGDLSLSDLAKETGIPQPTLHHIVEGKTKKPRKHALEALACFFSISVSQLIGTSPLSPTIPSIIKDSLKISTVPLIDWHLAKDWSRSKNKNDISKFEEIILNRQVDENAFAIQLKNTSLEPLFQEKSILIFDPSKIAKERDFALVHLYKTDSIVFNRLFIDGDNIYLKQDKKNGDAELIKLTFPQDKVLATLIESRLQF